MRISSTRFLIFVGLALFNGCSTPPKAIDSKASIEGASEAETTKFQEVQRLFLAGKFEALLQHTKSFSKSYPGVYWNLSTLSQVMYDAEFMRRTVFAKLRDFQLQTGSPVFIGEMGMYKPQNGSAEYIGDILDICKDSISPFPTENKL